LRKVEIATGKVVQQVAVGSEHFAEGLADIRDRLVQLTWQSHVGLVYDLKTLALQRTFPYEGEGWGLVRDGNRLIMSDGSSALRFLDPDSFKETRRITVTEDGRPLADLNELEMVKGQLVANIWMTDQLAIINPATGVVTGRVNLRGLLAPTDLQRRVDVLNGIAYDAAGDRLFVTGKWWPKLFEIRLKTRP
jgi:glutaminyl-peptide cyclotransferase